MKLNLNKAFIFQAGLLLGWILSELFLELPELPPIFEGAPVPFLVSMYLFALVFFIWAAIQLMKRVCA